jgi:glutamyl-tRNA reductase
LGVSADDMGSAAREHGIREPEVQACSTDVEHEMKMTGRVRRVAVLGAGTMGAPMARNLAHAGYRVRVWNRTPAKAAALTADGATPADTPAEAADGADVLITESVGTYPSPDDRRSSSPA